MHMHMHMIPEPHFQDCPGPHGYSGLSGIGLNELDHSESMFEPFVTTESESYINNTRTLAQWNQMLLWIRATAFSIRQIEVMVYIRII